MALFKPRWIPDLEELTYPLTKINLIQMDFSEFSKGIDNVHIDITLSQQFSQATFNLVQQATQLDVARNLWREEKKLSLDWNKEEFTETYKILIETMIHRCHHKDETTTLPLLYTAIYRLIFISFNSSIEQIRNQLKEVASAQTGKSLEYHERTVQLAKGEDSVRYRVLSMIFDLLNHYEKGHLQKIRESLLHQPWVLSPELLFNPLLSIGNIDQNENLRFHYPLALNNGPFFQTVGIVFYNLFKHWLPLVTKPIPQDRPENWTIQKKNRFDQGTIYAYLKAEIQLDYLVQEQEYKKSHTCWMDAPENLDALLGGTQPKFIKTGIWEHKNWSDFQKQQLQDLQKILQQQKLLQPIWASYATNKLHNKLGSIVPIFIIFDYLSGKSSKKVLTRQIEAINGLYNPEATIQQIDNAAKIFKQLTKDEVRVLMVTFMCDFLRFRRDLKIAWMFYYQMDQINILRDSQEIELSIANHHLYSFHINEEDEEEKRIHTHCILKADLRGSTGITSSMREKNLNPASYFSKNFFDPINKVLATYDANKVFIEGDALILVNHSYSETGGGLAIARSCGLAIEMIKIVRRKAIENRRHKLPPLELGIGIVFCGEPPTFLNDDGHQIMISPAINWADRLSGCHAKLKNKKKGIGEEGQGVYARYKDDEQQRYNVNGIILDIPAFHHLIKEIKLKDFTLKSNTGNAPHHFYIGQYPDINNTMRWLFIRKGKTIGREVPQALNNYYEVISDSSVIHKVKAALTKKAKEKKKKRESP